MAGNFIERLRHGTIFYFRRRVPRDLIDRVGKRHIYVTLHTHERRTALVRARLLAVQTDREFEGMRNRRSLEPHYPPMSDSRRGRSVEKDSGMRGSNEREGFKSKDYHVAIDLDDERRPKKVVFTDVNPGDEESVAGLTAKLAPLNGALSAAGRTTPTIREAIDDLVASGEVGRRDLHESKAAVLSRHQSNCGLSIMPQIRLHSTMPLALPNHSV